MNTEEISSTRKWKHEHFVTLACQQSKQFLRQDGVRGVYGPIAEHTQLLSITSVICWLHLSTGTCSLELVFSLIRLVPRYIFKHNPSYHHILASAHAPQSQPWQYPWSEVGSQQGWSCWQFQCIELICTKMQTFLFREARKQLRYDGGSLTLIFFNFLSAIMLSCMMRMEFFRFWIKETTKKMLLTPL
jgi:hypothetical protein